MRRYRWLPIDLDAVRPAGISSTEAEHGAALSLAGSVARWLIDEMGFRAEALVIADSGNGAHVLVRIDEPADAATRTLIGRCLAALDLRWSTSAVQIDTSTANPARIWRLYGTVAAKGDPTPDRPHRRSALISVPALIEVVPHDVLERLAALAPPDPTPNERREGRTLDAAAWLAEHGIAVARTRPWQGGTLYELDGCPMDESHERDRAAFVIQHASGAIAAGCHHDRCGWGWRELRDKYEPAGARTQRRATGQRSAEEHEAERPIGVFAHEVTRERIRWLWPGRLARGKVHLLGGDPEMLKTTLAVKLVADLSQGRALPGELCALVGPMASIIFSWEDSAADTLRGRLELAGADLSRVLLVEDDLPTIPDDLASIERAVDHAKERTGLEVGLVVLDPLSAALGGGVDSHNNASSRRALSPLKILAQRHDIAVLLIEHMNKNVGQSAIHRVMGSIAFIAAARIALVAAFDPDDPEEDRSRRRRILARAKGNFGRTPPALIYESKEVPLSDDPNDTDVTIVVTGVSEVSADRLVRPPETETKRREENDTNADDLLIDMLAKGPRPVSVVKSAAKEAGVKLKALERAKLALKVIARKRRDGVWFWSLPGALASWTDEEVQDARSRRAQENLAAAEAAAARLRDVLRERDPDDILVKEAAVTLMESWQVPRTLARQMVAWERERWHLERIKGRVGGGDRLRLGPVDACAVCRSTAPPDSPPDADEVRRGTPLGADPPATDPARNPKDDGNPKVADVSPAPAPEPREKSANFEQDSSAAKRARNGEGSAEHAGSTNPDLARSPGITSANFAGARSHGCGDAPMPDRETLK